MTEAVANLAPPCRQVDCPVPPPAPATLRRVRTLVLPAGTPMYRAHRSVHRPDRLVPGVGNTRFAPLAGAAHTYLSTSRTAALLESALHELAGPDPTIYRAALAPWRLTPVVLRSSIRVADLRDPELARLGIDRSGLTATEAVHYPCTRRWAEALCGRGVGPVTIAGAVWHSRQAEQHAIAHAEGVLGDLLTHRNLEVAVVWSPPAPGNVVGRRGHGEDLVTDGVPSRLLMELAALLGAPIE